MYISFLTFGDSERQAILNYSAAPEQHVISPSGGCVQASVEKASTFCRESIQIALLFIQNEMSLFCAMQCLKIKCLDKV